MCLAPCFAGCTREAYDVEVGRVLAALDTTGASLKEQLEREREAASEALDFEGAATIHKRLEKVSTALWGLPELVRRIEKLDAVILQRAVEEKSIVIFQVRGGLIGEPIFLHFAESSQPRSVEASLRHELEPEVAEASAEPAKKKPAKPEAVANEAPPESANSDDNRELSSAEWRERYGLHSAPAELSEHLALIARWFYSKPREGEIFFREKDWPYRRILRACGRLLQPSRPEAVPGEARPPKS